MNTMTTKRIYLAGHRGMVGSAIARQLTAEGHTLVTRTRSELDLTDQAEVRAFFHDIPSKLAQSHLVICRAGAATVSEIVASKRPAIFIPLAIAADNHQYFNAKAISDKNAAWIIEEKDFNIAKLQILLSKLLKNPILLANASEKARDLKWIDSGDSLLKLVESLSAIG